MSETSEIPAKAVGPNVMVGAASPLWGYFAGAAAAGVAFWWMTRPLRADNLEALFIAGRAAALPSPETGEAEVPFVPTEAVASEASGAVEDVMAPEPSEEPPAPAANDPAPGEVRSA